MSIRPNAKRQTLQPVGVFSYKQPAIRPRQQQQRDMHSGPIRVTSDSEKVLGPLAAASQDRKKGCPHRQRT